MTLSRKMKNLDNLRYEPVGRCIYCGRTNDLRNEHILPFGLSGTATLPDASCGECATITGRLEQKVLRGPMWAVRAYRGLRSRTKHKDAPEKFGLTVVKGGKENNIEVPIDDYPILLHFPIFSPPGELSPDDYSSGIRIRGLHTLSFGPKPEETARKLGATTVKLVQRSEPVAFARMIAKIAYSWAVAEKKVAKLDGEPCVLSAILGTTDDIGRWVWTLAGFQDNREGVLHYIALHEDFEKGLLIAEVCLFGDSQAPRYGVILGRLASRD